MHIDYSSNPVDCTPVVINNEAVQVVCDYKYLGSVVDSKLKGTSHVKHVTSKARKRLYFLRQLYQVNIDSKILTLFYTSIIQSVLCFCLVCWYGNLRKKDRKAPDRITSVASKLGCTDLKTLYEIYTVHVNKFRHKITNNCNHLLNANYSLLPSGIRLSSLLCRTNRYKNSFVPKSIRQFNNVNLDIQFLSAIF
jgi:hypothetical protein